MSMTLLPITQMTTRELTSVHVRIHNGTCDDALLAVCFVATTIEIKCMEENKEGF